ncbi:MAG: hypothetical protein M1570_02315 [Chloroflexi bacterium]|nr:hypothetical protein [Chloroflexota bacterium]
MRRVFQNQWTVGIATNLIVLALTAAASKGFSIGSVPLYVPIAAILASLGATALLHASRRVRLYYTREEAYRAACETIKATQPTKNENVIWIESINSTSDRRRREARRQDVVIGEYEAAIMAKIMSSEWRVQRLFNIPSTEILQWVVETYVDPFPTARCYEVRAIIPGSASATLGPLIIGEKDVLVSVAQDDTGAKACIHMHDRTIVSLMKDHYRALWGAGTVVLRDSDGKNEAGLATARDRLNSTH